MQETKKTNIDLYDVVQENQDKFEFNLKELDNMMKDQTSLFTNTGMHSTQRSS